MTDFAILGGLIVAMAITLVAAAEYIVREITR